MGSKINDVNPRRGAVEMRALSLPMAVDELHKAWAKLHQLGGQERHLVEWLSHIHKEIEAQRLKIDDLVKARPPPINRLPTELLSRIFTLCIPDPKFPEKPLHRIVCVSRLWRDVVWNDTSFWTSIKVTRTQGEKLLKNQLKRSRKALLDIWIEDWDYRPLHNAYDKLRALLGAIVPHANRWRSLIISYGMKPEFMESILTEINCVSIPFLREFSMDFFHVFDDPPCADFLSRAPALQHLTIISPFQLVNFIAPPTLETLCLTFPQVDDPPPVISMLTSARSLRALILTGYGTGWSFKLNDIHSPLLEELTLRLSKPMPFLEAIVAPKLRYIECWILDPMEFNTIEGKFRDVNELSLVFFQRVDDRNAESLCRAFPGVRRVDLSSWNTSFLAVFLGSEVLERRPPMDQWLNLETVNLDGFDSRLLGLWKLGDDPIVKWLRSRQELGLSRLRVRLSFIRKDVNILPSTYRALLERYCNLQTPT